MSRVLSVVSCQLPAGRTRLRRGFSFTEVMFAVIILGIGFIMVAGIFPVALQQAKLTTEETTGAALARAGAGFLGELGDDSLTTPNMPGTGTATVPTRPSVAHFDMSTSVLTWQNAVGNMVQSDDPRFAWTAMYRRDGNPANKATWAPFAQVYVFALTARATEQFAVNIDGKQLTPTQMPNLQPKPVRLAILNDVIEAGGMDLIGIFPSAGPDDYTGAAVEGAYVIIQNDGSTDPPEDIGRMNGRIFRLGPERADMLAYVGTAVPGTLRSVYELQPGNDFAPHPGANGVLFDPSIPGTALYQLDDITAIGYPSPPPSTVDSALAEGCIIGRSYADPVAGLAGGFSGTSMAISAYTSFVRIKQ